MPAERSAARARKATPVPVAIRALWLAADVILVAVALACALLLLVRFVAFPRIEAHHDDIAAALGERIGQPVTIGAIETGWDGWNPRLSIRAFSVMDPSDRTTPVLTLPRVDLVVSWTSLPLLDLRLRELAVEGPRLAVRRDETGLVHVAGIAIDPGARRDDNAVTDWLLRQPRILVHDGLVTWTDEVRHTPQLVLDQVDLRIEQGFGTHRFGLTGVPPAELAAPLDVRGEFSAASLREWQHARGKAYVRLDYADLAAWREWLPLPVAVDSGKGAVRLWFDFAEGAPRAITADVELVDVRAQLAHDLPAMELAHVAGRIGGRQDGVRHELDTRAFTFVAQDGVAFPPTDLHLRYDDARDGAAASGDVSFDRLELGPITSLAAHLPLPERWRREIALLAPKGVLREARLTWEGPADAPTTFHASATLSDVAINAHDNAPGASGLTGRLDATETKGSLALDAHAMALSLPRVFATPLSFDGVGARIGWTRSGETTSVQVDDATFTNADFAGTASGTWHSVATGPGMVDARAQLTRASVEPLNRYAPSQLHPRLREWLARALVKGSSNDVRVTLRGNLAEFPFPQGRNGQFMVVIKARDATLDYAEHWPPLSDLEGEVRIEGSRLMIDGTRGRVLGASIGRTHVEIADMRERPATVKVEGEAEGPTAEFLAFIHGSPVGEWVGDATKAAQAAGNGRLSLKFALPLNGGRANGLTGEYQFIDNQVHFPGAPALAAVNGKLTFTDREITGRDIAAEAFGGPVKLQLATAEGRVKVNATGTSNVTLLRHEFEAPMIDRMSGNADWQLSVDARPDAVGWVVETSLKGVSVDLPAPLGKTADEARALRIVRREVRAGREDALTFDYGHEARVVVHRQIAADPRVDRVLVLLGKAMERSAEPQRSGLWIRADVPSLNVDDWLAWQRKQDAGSGNSGGQATGRLAFDGFDIEAGMLQALGRRFDDLKVTGRRTGDDWRLTLDGREIAGNAIWQAATPSQPNGRVVARLARLVPPAAGELTPWSGAAEEPARSVGAGNPWPAIDVTADALFARGREVGRLEVLAHPAAADWQIEKLSVTNDAGRIDAQGVWRGGRAPQTRLDVKVDVKEAGRFLAYFAMPDAIRAAPTTIEGQLAWDGAPSDFDYPSLGGSFAVRAGAGQFLKADPGVGRLLGVLSLQALPRRITLDFRDVFSEGFAFDSVVGNVRIQKGVMHTETFKLAGPAAAVDIAGDVDLARETQQLRVRVQPSLSSSVSAGAAALFIANPLVGAVVGAGTLLAQKMLNNPIEQLFAYEYAVSGAWDDPVVQRLSSRTAAARPESAAK
ncbi:MAG TPA: YhdP family protein [Casimicrobiaceae bacterium]|nr:YhdP family protein [Casimicrobiaceae bacterium]